MRFSVLGPVEVAVPGRVARPIAPRHQAVLAYLLLNARQVVGVERLTDALWGGSEPTTSKAQIQASVSAIRRMLRELGQDELLLTRPAGYLFGSAAGALDLESFTELVARARRSEQRDPAAAARLLREALELWRGEVLAGISAAYAEGVRTWLAEERLGAEEQLADLDLVLGRHAEVLATLAARAAAHPERERPQRQVMTALHRCGRQAEALEVARRFRKVLAEEQGLDPSRGFEELETAILRGEAAVPAEPPGAAPVPAEETPVAAPVVSDPALVPAQLPSAPSAFTGRTECLQELDGWLAADRDGVATVVLSGPGGIGKSALALSWAHRVRAGFPDGQFHLDLHGTSATPSVRPVDALARCLRALGVPADRVPTETEEAAALYRTVLAERRVLVLLDNAEGSEQVRPLLPGGPGSLVLVTSRSRCGGLLALDGAHRLDLEVLTEDEAVALLRRIAGQGRELEPADARELARLCGQLPLALCIAAARLRSEPQWTVRALIRRLADERHRLDELSMDDVTVRASFLLGYQRLTPEAARLFRGLSLLEATEFGPWTAAAVLDRGLGPAQAALAVLVEAQLLQVAGTDGQGWSRYRFHDLIRLLARELAVTEDGAEDRAAVVRRALGGWLALAEAAHQREYGGEFAIVHGGAERWRLPAEDTAAVLADPAQWLESERYALLAAVVQAAATDAAALAWDLAVTSVTLFETRGYLEDWRRTHECALEACRRAGDRLGEAVLTYSLGSLALFRQRYEAAAPLLESAEQRFAELDNRHGQALALRNLALVDRLAGRLDQALDRYGRARPMLEEAGDRATTAHVLACTAQVHLDRGDHQAAEELLMLSLAAFSAIGNRRGQAQAHFRLGELRLNQGEFAASEESLAAALRLVEQTGDLIGEVYLRRTLGEVQLRRGCLESAEATLNEARALAVARRERFAEARACHSLGELAIARGDVASARAGLTEAARLFGQLGAELWRGRVAELLAGLGAPEPGEGG